MALHDGNRFLGYINLERRLGMDSQHAGTVQRPYLTYQPARLNSLLESILLLLAGGILSLESIPALHKRLEIQALTCNI
jgi:hypothetical protein